MKSIDVYTLVYIITAISFVSGALMLVFVKIVPYLKGPLFWSIGSFSVGLGAFLFSINPILPAYISYVVSGTFSLLGPSLYIAGLQKFKGKQINKWLFPGIPVAQFISGSFFVLVIPDATLRMTCFSILFLIMSSYAVYEFLLPCKKPYKLAFRLGALTFTFSVISSISRTVLVWLVQPETIEEITNTNKFIYFMGNAQQASFLFLFMLMIGIYFTENLNQRITDQHRFFSIIGHDLKSPVGTISEMLNIVNNDKELPEKNKNILLAEAEKLSGSTFHLVNNLLLWGKNQLNDLKPIMRKVNVNDIIKENITLIEGISNHKSVTINYSPCPDMTCKVDDQMISAVIRNIISNSVKFSHKETTINISCSRDEKYLKLKVTDQGIGMSEKTLSTLFNKDEPVNKPGTAGERGTGLGLLICKNFIDKNNGAIEVKSVLNKGTEVTIDLPVAN